MATIESKGGPGLDRALKELGERFGGTKKTVLNVGFLADAKYPDGTQVAYVALLQNFGTDKIPATFFFSNMVDEKSPEWGPALAAILPTVDYDVTKALDLMGKGISEQLSAAIEAVDGPALSPITLMLRKMWSEDQSLVITGATVGEAARRVAEGESTDGVSTKRLVFTAVLRDAPAWEIVR